MGHINEDENGAITTTWTQFRPDPENVQVQPEFDYSNMGDVNNTSPATKFYASLANSAYIAGALEYFESPIDMDAESGGLTALSVPAVYKHEIFSNIDNMKVYSPLLTDPVLSPAPIYVVFRGTDTLFDTYRDVAIVYDYLTNQPLQQLNNEVNTIVATISNLITTMNRPVYLIGHSLGGIYALHVLHKLITKESPNYDHIEHTFKAIIFNPLLVMDSTTEYFRTIKKDYAKTNIEIHTIRGDFLSPLLYRSGVGKVYAYDNNVPPLIDHTDFLLGTFLTQTLGTTNRDSYLNDDNHKIVTFGANANGIEPYLLVQPLVLPQHATIQTVVQRDIGNLLDQAGSHMTHLYIYDKTDNLDSSKQYIDYPAVSHTVNNYNYQIAKYSDSFIISEYGGTKYINFQLSINPDSDNNKYLYRYLVRVGDNEYLLSYSETQSYKLNNTINPDLPAELLIDNTSVFYNQATAVEHVNRFKFNLGQMVVNASFHVDMRRTFNTVAEYQAQLTPPPSPPTPIPSPPPTPPSPATPPPPSNPWAQHTDNIQYHMWVQNQQSATETRGYIGYVRIKSKYMSDLYNKGVYCLNETTSNPNGYLTYSPKWEGTGAISWNDNDTQPDEHIWKIQYFGNDSSGEPLFNLTNTMSGFPFASWYLPGAYLASTLASVKIDYHRHIATGNNSPVVRTYYVKSTHFESSSNDNLGKIFSRQTQYNIDHHYGSAMITTADTVLDTDDRMREWIFEFI